MDGRLFWFFLLTKMKKKILFGLEKRKTDIKNHFVTMNCLC